MDEKSNKKRTGKQGKDRYTTNKLALGAENKKRQNLWIRYVNLVCIDLRLRSSQRGCYARNLFYKFSKLPMENRCTRVSFSTKLQAAGLQLRNI